MIEEEETHYPNNSPIKQATFGVSALSAEVQEQLLLD
jgi:hypothetical protein